jgi:tRNA pseudouridine38-40 synthase
LYDGPSTNKKVRVALIVGYNGMDFHGSQKNKGVRTVEEEIEHALYKHKLIAKHNYGDLQKIAFNRATRTDKKVHALQNCFSCKIQYDDKGKDY